jgi:hypothetical protein
MPIKGPGSGGRIIAKDANEIILPRVAQKDKAGGFLERNWFEANLIIKTIISKLADIAMRTVNPAYKTLAGGF